MLYNAARFDCVQVRMSDDSLGYGLLRILFTYNDQDMAMTRWFDVVPSPKADPLTGRGCCQLNWATTRHKLPHYQVLPLSSIQAAAYIVQDLKQAGVDILRLQDPWLCSHFHVCQTKWARRPATMVDN
jgi:hypothetical protein